MKTRIAVALALLMGATLALAQTQYPEAANLMYLKNIGSATKTYCVLNGSAGPWSTAIAGAGTLSTTGSSTTVEASDPAAFTNVAAGDMIIALIANVPTARTVASKTDNDTIEVDTAVTWSAYTWSWRDSVCGTTDADGWLVSTPGMTLTYSYVSGSGTSEVFWQCKDAAVGALPVQIYPDNSTGAAVRSYTSSGYDSRTTVVVPADAKFQYCRVGVSGTGPVVSVSAAR